MKTHRLKLELYCYSCLSDEVPSIMKHLTYDSEGIDLERSNRITLQSASDGGASFLGHLLFLSATLHSFFVLSHNSCCSPLAHAQSNHFRVSLGCYIYPKNTLIIYHFPMHGFHITIYIYLHAWSVLYIYIYIYMANFDDHNRSIRWYYILWD
jgi:hypothetical protein